MGRLELPALRTSNLAGRWLVAAYMPGRGGYYGEMQMERAGEDEYNTRVSLTSVRDGSRIIRSGRSAVYGASAWRGRSKGNEPEGSAPDDPSSEAREVLWIAPDQSTAEGRWFWGQYQEFGFNVKLRRGSSDPTLIVLDRASLKTASQGESRSLDRGQFPGSGCSCRSELRAGRRRAQYCFPYAE